VLFFRFLEILLEELDDVRKLPSFVCAFVLFTVTDSRVAADGAVGEA
jgi:hypothetical protein